jgi:hypothetical protein
VYFSLLFSADSKAGEALCDIDIRIVDYMILILNYIGRYKGDIFTAVEKHVVKDSLRQCFQCRI